MATEKWAGAPTSRGSVLSTELNSLSNGSYTAAGSAIDNSANLDVYGWVELAVTFGSAPSAGGYVNVYAVQALDGTNYEDGGGSVAPGKHLLVATIPVRAVTTAQRVRSRRFTLDPAKTKYVLEDQTGQAFPASGSTLTLYTANDSIA